MRTKVVIITGLATLLPVAALAAASTATPQQVESARCQRVTGNIANRITAAEARQTKLANDHAAVVQHWTNVVSRAGAAGVSSSDPALTGLQGDISKYQGEAATAESDFSTYLADLQDTQNEVCGHSGGAFSAAVNTARKAFAAWRTDQSQLHNLRVTTHNGDLKNVIKEIHAKGGK